MAETPEKQFPVKQVELAPLANDLALTFSAGFYEDELATIPATSIVYSGETYYVKLTWKLTGKLALHFCGKWLVKIDLESIGVAKEYSSECVTIDMDPCNPEGYSYIFKLTPETVEPAACGTVYILAATLSSLDPCGHPGHIWAYGTGVDVMFVPGKPD